MLPETCALADCPARHPNSGNHGKHFLRLKEMEKEVIRVANRNNCRVEAKET